MAMRICIAAGVRPNFIKIAPIVDAVEKYNASSDPPMDYFVVHTGQHYDERMSKLFFKNLGIPSPNINLEVRSASHAFQTAEIMKRFEGVCLKEKPSHVLVVGDVNSTIACALVASKLKIKIIHVEAGLRSFDRSMPEEINRLLTDAISDLLFTTEESANENLRREGIPKEKIHFVGNVMIDTLVKHREKAQQSDILSKLNLNNSGAENQADPYAVLTLHRPSNVDDGQKFPAIVDGLAKVSREIPIIFPIHPRTAKRIKEFNCLHYFNCLSPSSPKMKANSRGINCIDPLGYLDFLHLMSNSKLVLTDSGGIQEETTILRIPCVTIRDNTERPITVTHGTNRVVGTNRDAIINGSFEALEYSNSPFVVPPLWDGRAAERIVRVLAKSCANPDNS